jgi:hypothetical protein
VDNVKGGAVVDDNQSSSTLVLATRVAQVVVSPGIIY